jgi:hypothetical protein
VWIKISVFLCFLIVCRLTQVLVFIESVIVRKKGGRGKCELMMLSILNHFSLFDLLVVFDWWKHINMDVTLPFWVIMRSGRWNVMNHIPTKGGPYLVVGVRGILLPWVIVRRERRHDHIWISIFLWRRFRGGYALIWEMGGVYSYRGTPQRHRFLGDLKCVSPYYLHCFYLLWKRLSGWSLMKYCTSQ